MWRQVIFHLGVTFYLDIITGVWEALPLLRENARVLTVFLKAEWFYFPDISLGTFFLFLPLSNSVVLSLWGTYILLCRAVYFPLHILYILGDSRDFTI